MSSILTPASMELNPLFTALWFVWGMVFLAIEIPALRRRRRGDTLTDHVMWLKRWKVKGKPVGFVAFLTFWIWLTLHFFLEIF